MIWVWLRQAIYFLGVLLIPPPKPSLPLYQPIDPNAPCPACGHRNGKIRCVLPSPEQPDPTIMHQCSVCGARFFEKTVVQGDNVKELIHPAE